MDIKENIPELWADQVPVAKAQDNKYTRGQVAVLGGDEMTGAACLAADAAARVGAGLVTIIAQKRSILQSLNPNAPDPLPVYKNFRPYIIARRNSDMSTYVDKAKKKGRVASVIGPGLGNNAYKRVRSEIFDVLNIEDAPLVIDADGLNAFAGEAESENLCKGVHNQTVLTPHEGEFKKLFPQLAETLKNDRQSAAMEAARLLFGGVLVLKGHETIIAQYVHSKERMLINKVANPYLASAGTGDVLSGLIAGLMAQGMSAFQAAAAGVWMHGKASQNIGVGLVAEDLIKNIPRVLKEMLGI